MMATSIEAQKWSARINRLVQHKPHVTETITTRVAP